jgi:hypothetical protein
LTQSHDEGIARAARLLADALSELQEASRESAALQEDRNRIAIEALGQRLEQQLIEDRQQRALLAGQLTNLASSLDRLVTHLEGLSHLMAELIERLEDKPASTQSPTAPDAPPAPSALVFRPGGEGVALTISGVPGFQALMDIQKSLMGLEQVQSASVERFQEGDSKIQVHLREAITAADVANALTHATGHAFTVEEARPELMRLRLKIVG